MDSTSEGKLRPALGLFDATAIGIGAIVGGGIFVVTGIVAGIAGPGLLLSITISAIIALITALSFVELTTWLPVEGSVYEFAHRLLSPSAGFLTGWMWVVSNAFAGAAVALGFAYYLEVLLPGNDPRFVAAILCLAFTVMNYFGIRQSALVNNALVLGKVAILVLFVGVGFLHFNAGNFRPFIPSELGVLYGAYFIFFAYAGFARVAIVAEEVKDARRVVPRSIILALAISTVIYVFVAAAAVGLIGAGPLGGSNAPLVQAIGIVGNPALTLIVSLGGMIATASVLLTSILGVSRLEFAMARNRDLPSAFAKVHKRYATPHFAVAIAGGIMALLALSVDLTGIVGVSTFAQLLYYASANLSALRLKAESRLYPRFLPAIGVGTCIALLIFVKPLAFELGIVCLVAGGIYYVLTKRSTRRRRKTRAALSI